MQFIKKNYEKILLGLVLVGLVVASVFLLIKVGNERNAQEDRRHQIMNYPVQLLAPPDLTNSLLVIKRGEMPVAFKLSDNDHRLLNPVRWQKNAEGKLFKNPAGAELEKVEVSKLAKLFLTITLDSVSISDAGARYVVTVENQAASKQSLRGKKPFYVSVGDKKDFGDGKQFTLREVKGATNDPTELVLDLSDSPDKPVSISKDRPFTRVDAYMADMKYPPENRIFLGRRVGDKIIVAGEEYNIVAITETEVVLSAKSNQKKWTIKNNIAAAP